MKLARVPLRVSAASVNCGTSSRSRPSSARLRFSLYEAPDPEALYRQARELGIPADSILEVSEINPTMFSGHSVTGHLAT